jgi:hypothetical protein
LRALGIGVALLLAGSAPTAAADAIAAYGEFYVRSSIIAKCHSTQDEADRTYLAKGEALRRAALEEFWAEIDAVNPTHHRENRLRAEEMLQQGRAGRDDEIDAQIKNKGCERAERESLPDR